MASSSVDDPPGGLFVSPLKHVKRSNAKKTAKKLVRLLLSLGVRNSDIAKIIVEPKDGFALIHLHSQEAEDFIVRACKDVRDVLNFFDLRVLTSKPRQFRVIRRNSPRFLQQWEGTFPNRDGIDRDTTRVTGTTGRSLESANITHPSHLKLSHESLPAPPEPGIRKQAVSHKKELTGSPAAKTFKPSSSSPSSSTTTSFSSSSASQQGFEKLEEERPRPVMLHASTSTSLSQPGCHDQQPLGEPVAKVDVKTSTPQVSPCFCPETVFFHMKQYVGSENRHVEFKRGGNINDLRTFRSVVGKYMCAFLNTEGGTIYFGVEDDGTVVGIQACQRLEDMIRLTIDTAVTMIKPFVDTSAYSVNFAKIMSEDGVIIEDLKVIEICVKPRDPPEQKFSFNEVAYVRRDGSLRTL